MPFRHFVTKASGLLGLRATGLSGLSPLHARFAYVPGHLHVPQYFRNAYVGLCSGPNGAGSKGPLCASKNLWGLQVEFRQNKQERP